MKVAAVAGARRHLNKGAACEVKRHDLLET